MVWVWDLEGGEVLCHTPHASSPLPRRPPACPTPHPTTQSMVFFQKMGAMNDVPVLGQDFNTWFPLVLLVYVALLALNWWERCCSRIFVASRFRFDTVGGWVGGRGAWVGGGGEGGAAGERAPSRGNLGATGRVVAQGRPARPAPRASAPTSPDTPPPHTPTLACARAGEGRRRAHQQGGEAGAGGG